MKDIRRNLITYLTPIVLMLLATLTNAQESTHQLTKKNFKWDVVANLPLGKGGAEQIGFAGSYAGIDNGVLILAGGANFPDGLPWEGGKKRWSKSIFILSKDFEWISDVQQELPQSMAYGITVPTSKGLVLIGGNNELGTVLDILLLSYNNISKEVEIMELGKLPNQFEVTSGSLLSSDEILVSGVMNGDNQLIKISTEKLLSPTERNAVKWDFLNPCPGPTRLLPAYALQNNGSDECLYLFGGRNESDKGITLLNDGYYYDTSKNSWNHLTSVPQVMGAPALSFGPSNILIFGGDNGEELIKRNSIQLQLSDSIGQQNQDTLNANLKNLFIDHKGFTKEVLSFNTITNNFKTAGTISLEPRVTTNAFFWDDTIIIPSGEIRPGIRSTEILRAKIDVEEKSFGVTNYIVLLAYFLILISIGIYFSSRQKTSEDYFVGGGRIPWWAAGLSVFGTALSAITFMAVPAKTFATDWSYLFYNLSVLLSTPLIVILFIPFYRRLNLTTAYQYLESRFNVFVRLFGSISFIVFQIGRIAIVLYLPAIALSLVTGIDIYICIIAVGCISVVYTLIGGIEAVIWTDVIQVVVLLGGAILSLVMIYLDLGTEINPLLNEAANDGKLAIADLSFAFNEPTIWVVIIGGFFANLITYSSDQTMVQRYLTTKDEKGAAKTAWTNALLIIPSTIIFFSVGTGLYLYYKKFPASLDALSTNNDAIFPWFIINELPAGVSGLLIAGLFSAAMSSLSSSINSSGTVFTIDIYKRFFSIKSEKQTLFIARSATLVSGIIGILFALWMASFDINSLWDQFFKILGLFTGGLGGLFLLGVCFKKANSTGAIVGLIVSSVVQFVISSYTDLHIFLYSATGLLSCVIVGYIESLLFPSKSDLKGQELTIHNKRFRG
ncbi:transporter, SSS family [Flavobacteriaceae bacterium MAR_2010_188]|nr:transporter, SSS family [Flavobacteriaceae bacterium MAR_2010_188]